MYYDETGIWSLSEIIMNEKKDKEITRDLFEVLSKQNQYAKNYFNDMYFEGCARGFDSYHSTRNDYMNCCLEESIAFGKEVSKYDRKSV